MRLIHTADWHLGRILGSKDRTPEIEFALNELLNQAKAYEVDTVLVAGDIFDQTNPSIEAERVAYQFFYGLQAAKIPAIVIAGNHDSATRFDSLANLLSLANVHILGKPRLAKEGGVVTLNTANGKLRVGAMPFANERRLLTPDALWNQDEEQQLQNYQETLTYILSDLASAFKEDSINILMAHLTIYGTQLADSERTFHSQGIYAISEQSFPSEAQYIALGHLHRTQSVKMAIPTYYAGSLIQVDFGEAEEEKGFYLIEVEPGEPAKVEFQSIPCQKPLKEICCDLEDLEEELAENCEHPGYLKVIVDLQTPEVGLANRVRKICPQTIFVESRYPEAIQTACQSQNGKKLFNPVEEYRSYYQNRLGSTLSPSVLTKFKELYKDMQNETH